MDTSQAQKQTQICNLSALTVKFVMKYVKLFFFFFIISSVFCQSIYTQSRAAVAGGPDTGVIVVSEEFDSLCAHSTDA